MVSMLVLSGTSNAQSVKEDMIRLNEHYTADASYSMNIQVSLYPGKDDVEPDYQYSGHVKKSGSNFYSELMDRITLINERCILSIDQSKKMIVYQENNRKNNTLAQQFSSNEIGAVLDSTFLGTNEVTLQKQEGHKKFYLIIPKDKNSEYDKMEMVINTNNYTIEKYTYYFRPEAHAQYRKIVILYSQVEVGKKPDPEVFSENQFVRKEGNRMNPAPSYNGYEIIEHSNVSN